MANITDIVNSIVRYLGKVSITLNGRWKDNIEYDRLCVVYDDFASYISKQKVPVGTKLTNTTYWQVLSNLQEEIKIDYETFKAEVLEDIADLNKRQIAGRIVVDNDNELNALTIEQVNAGAEVYVLDTKKTYIIDSIDTQNNKDYHEQVYNSLSTAAYSSVPKEDRKVENIKVLKDYVVEFGDKLTTFPITLIQAILDLESGKNLSSLLSMFNYLVLPWNGNFAATVNEVPLVMRNIGTLVTYKDADGFIWTKRYKLSDFSNINWSNIDNWEGWDLNTAKDEIIAVVEKIFTNIDDYPPVKEVVVQSVTTATNDVLNDIASHPDLYTKFKAIIETKVGDVFANLDNYPDLKILLNTYVVNQVNYIFNNINNYPTLKTTIENAIKSVFTNIDSYPAVKKVITDKIVEIAPTLINSVFNNINNYPTLKSAIDLSVYNRTDYVFNHLDDYPVLKALIEAGSGGGEQSSSIPTINFETTDGSIFTISNIDEVKSYILSNVGMPSICIVNVIAESTIIYNKLNCSIIRHENDCLITAIGYDYNADNKFVFQGNIETNSFQFYLVEKPLGTIYIKATYQTSLSNGDKQFSIENNAAVQIQKIVEAYPLDVKVYIFDCIITYKTEDPVWVTVRGTMQFMSDGANTNTAQIICNFCESGNSKILIKQEWSWLDINEPKLILNGIIEYSTDDFINKNQKGAASGICPLNASSKVDAKYLPSYVDDVMDFTTSTNFANTSEIIGYIAYTNQVIITGSTTVNPYKNKIIKLNANTSVNDWVYEDLVADKIYCNTTNNSTYRWSGTALAPLGAGVVIGEVTGTAYDGGKGKAVTDIVATLPTKLVDLQAISNNRNAAYYRIALQTSEKQDNGKYGAGTDQYIDIPLATAQYAGLISPTEKSKLTNIPKTLIFSSNTFANPDLNRPIDISLSGITFDSFIDADDIILKYEDSDGRTCVSKVENFNCYYDNGNSIVKFTYIMYSYEQVFTRLYCKFVVLENNMVEFLPYFQEDLYKGGFDLGEAFQWIFDKITEYASETWSPTEDEFKSSLTAEAVYTQLNIVNNPISFIAECVKNNWPMVCKLQFGYGNKQYYYDGKVPVVTGYTNSLSTNVNTCWLSATRENTTIKFLIQVDPDGLFTFKLDN
jgi:hypothetical protein